MSGNQTFVAMKRADGTLDSVVHLEAMAIKPDASGIVQIPGQFVSAMINAGYVMVVAAGTTHVP